jgi:hypothetical protein
LGKAYTYLRCEPRLLELLLWWLTPSKPSFNL